MMTMKAMPESDVRYELTIRTAGLQMFAALALTLAALAVVAPVMIGTTSVAAGSSCGLVLLGLGCVLWSAARRARILQPQPITLRPDYMVLPRGRYHQHSFQVQYNRVKAIDLSGMGRPRLTIELWTPEHEQRFAYSEKDFASADDLFAMLDTLRRRVNLRGRAA